MTALPRDGDVVGGKYRIVRLIGEGGMGAVFEAHHEHLGSEVALKFLHPDLQASPALVARFLQEARVSASIKSPHVTHVMDVDQTPEGAAYLVMELLEGESLERRMERQAPLPIAEAVDIALQILSALEAAHARGVVHRDLKPDNVWLSPTPQGPYVKLLDFGIAKLKSTNEFREVNTRPGSMMGTPAYMAPEQAISADQVDGRADLYSFGVILYEMLSGKRPVDAEDPREILEQLIRGQVHKLGTRSPSVPPGLAALVDRLVAPNPDDRPASATAARAELVPHARASGIVWQGDRMSMPVPATLPPDESGAPAFLTASQQAANAARPARTKTDSMPATPELAFQQTAVASHPLVHQRRRVWPWVLTALVVIGLAAFGIWASQNPSAFDDSALPPLPGPMPSVAPTAAGAEPASPEEIEPELPRAAPQAPRPSRPTNKLEAPPIAVPPTAPSPTATPTPGPTFALPQLPPPPFPIPSGLIPSALTPYIPQIPGWTQPAAPTPATPTPATPTPATSTTTH